MAHTSQALYYTTFQCGQIFGVDCRPNYEGMWSVIVSISRDISNPVFVCSLWSTDTDLRVINEWSGMWHVTWPAPGGLMGLSSLTTCHQLQCSVSRSDSSLITSCNELYLSCVFWGSCRIYFLDQFRLFSVSLQSLQSYFNGEVTREDDILLSLLTTYREIVSKISFISPNFVHNWLLDLEHAQKFLGSVNKYLISPNIYSTIIYFP